MTLATPLRTGVIMAGGSGERFWPLSRKAMPKQLLSLTREDKSMLAEAVDRLAAIMPHDHIYIATGRHLLAPIQAADIGVPRENILAEPCKRNTAGCLLYAAASLLARYDAPPAGLSMAVTTADHHIGDPALFADTMTTALDAAEQENALATIGIVPARPETGYGYIEVDAEQDTRTGYGKGVPVHTVRAFHEKPDEATATTYAASGRHFWNSGMFFWNLATFLEELRHARPDFADAVVNMAEAARAGKPETVETLFDALESISIDYALMEKARRVIMVRGAFPWDDVGAWPALDRTREHDAAGNVVQGDPVLVDCHDCIVYNHGGADQIATCVIGGQDLIVVTTGDAVLVAPKDRAQDVRQAVAALKERNAKQI